MARVRERAVLRPAARATLEHLLGLPQARTARARARAQARAKVQAKTDPLQPAKAIQAHLVEVPQMVEPPLGVVLQLGTHQQMVAQPQQDPPMLACLTHLAVMLLGHLIVWQQVGPQPGGPQILLESAATASGLELEAQFQVEHRHQEWAPWALGAMLGGQLLEQLPVVPVAPLMGPLLVDPPQGV